MPRPMTQQAGVALSVPGSSHLRDGRGCDDACALQWRGGAWLVAIADGAGSAPRSSTGAQLAVSSAMAWLRTNPLTAADRAPERHLERCLASTRRRLVGLASGESRPLHEYATTLAVAIVRPRLALAMHVGDGAVVVRRREGVYETLSREAKGGAANVADFLTDADFRQRTRFTRLKGDFDATAGMTDGLEPLAFTPDRRPFERFFDPLLACLRREGTAGAKRSLKSFLTSDRVRSASDDDLSVVLALLEKQS